MERILGSHNSLTGTRPDNWAARIGGAFCRCQRKDIRRQVKAGVRCFDIRLWWGKDGKPRYGHGLAEYYFNSYAASEPVWVIDNIVSHVAVADDEDAPLYVRLILEHPRNNGRERFVSLCKSLEAIYPRVVFFEGRDRRTWEKLYTFRHEGSVPTVYEHHASVSGSGLLRCMPRLWWRLFGRDYEAQEGINLVDFV